MNKNKKGVSISEIVERLKISRNYITRNITHCIKHIEKDPSRGARVIFDEQELREYLKNQATFTRQTKRINFDYEIEKYNRQHPDKPIDDNNFDKFKGNIPKMSEIPRSQLPAIPVEPFDFWDMPLIFPKEYVKGEENAKIATAEICYRDMFDIGAVKIQLGKQKTMFCIVDEPEIVSKYRLVPADWQPFYKGIATVDKESKKLSPFHITIHGDDETLNWREIEIALRNSLILDKVTDYKSDAGKFCVEIVARLQKEKL